MPKPDPILIDNEKILAAIGESQGKILVFTRQEAQIANAEALRSQLSHCTLVEHELAPRQLIPKFDLGIILQRTDSAFAFTQAISHVIRAKRIIAVDENGAVMELSTP